MENIIPTDIENHKERKIETLKALKIKLEKGGLKETREYFFFFNY